MNYDQPVAEVNFFEEVVGNSRWESDLDVDGEN